ncbi:MAG: carbohydrate ABC transporter permease [Chitinophagales bacterium]
MRLRATGGAARLPLLTQPVGAGRAPARRRLLRRHGLPYLLLAPALACVLVLTIYPLLQTVWLSFHKLNLVNLGKAPAYVGLANYRRLLTDSFFWFVARNTARFTLACVVLTMLLGFGVGLLLSRRFRGRSLLGVAVLLPWVMPKVAAGIIWKWIFDDQYGIANYLLTRLGLPFRGFSWFTAAPVAFGVILLVVVWQSFPFIALSVLAGLQSIDPSLYEAAEVDGASAWQRLRYITLPMLKSLLVILTILSTVWDFKIFDQVYVMTEGGPAQSTYVMGIHAWMAAFGEMQMGQAAAIAVVMFLILALITVIYLRAGKEEAVE